MVGMLIVGEATHVAALDMCKVGSITAISAPYSQFCCEPKTAINK